MGLEGKAAGRNEDRGEAPEEERGSGGKGEGGGYRELLWQDSVEGKAGGGHEKVLHWRGNMQRRQMPVKRGCGKGKPHGGQLHLGHQGETRGQPGGPFCADSV